MDYRHLLAFLTLAGATLQAAYGAQEPTSRPTTQMADPALAAKVAELIKAVAEAKDPTAAGAAYTRANTLDPSSAKLHETYIARMLKFGRPEMAMDAAEKLVTLNRDHGLAWGLIGYVHGTKGELDQAFEATMQAAGTMQDDPSILNHAAQLAAWYDTDPDRPDVDPAAERSLKEARSELAKKKEFTNAYNRIADQFKQLTNLKGKQIKDMQAFKDAISTLRQKLIKAEVEYDRIMRETDSCGQELSKLNGNRSAWARATSRRMSARLHELRKQGEGLLKDTEFVVVQLKANQGRIAPLRKELEKDRNRIHGSFRWDPPAVAGVVTPAAERSGDTASTKPANGADDQEALAAWKLNAAQRYLRRNQREKAIEILVEIFLDYGSTKTAQEAEQPLGHMSLLERMRNPR